MNSKKNRLTLVVLPLPWWVKYSTESIVNCTSGEIPPIFFRDGLYLDRICKWVWIEYEKKAYDYTNNYDYVKYELNLLNHTPLTNKQSQYINFIIKSKLATKELKHLYYTDRDWKEIRKTERNARKIRIEIQKDNK